MRKFSKLLAILLIFVLPFVAFAEGKNVSTTLQAKEENETVAENFDEGYWLYESKDLRVEIKRFEDSKIKLIWYEADIKFNDKNTFVPYSADPEKVGKTFKFAEEIARNNRLVFAINDDQVGYRIYNHKVVGHVIRNGVILGNKTFKTQQHSLPNLDLMVIDNKGEMKVFAHNEHTAEELLEMGYNNVFCFGPIIIRDGEINPIFNKHYRIKEPRTTLGMIEPNHYICISCEGRRERTLGASLMWVGERMKELGVKQAYNFDGGGTTSLLFMGTKLNFYNPKGEVKKDRALSGVVGIGHSELVKKWEGLGK